MRTSSANASTEQSSPPAAAAAGGTLSSEDEESPQRDASGSTARRLALVESAEPASTDEYDAIGLTRASLFFGMSPIILHHVPRPGSMVIPTSSHDGLAALSLAERVQGAGLPVGTTAADYQAHQLAERVERAGPPVGTRT